MTYISREAIGLTDFEILLCQQDKNKYTDSSSETFCSHFIETR